MPHEPHPVNDVRSPWASLSIWQDHNDGGWHLQWSYGPVNNPTLEHVCFGPFDDYDDVLVEAMSYLRAGFAVTSGGWATSPRISADPSSLTTEPAPLP